MKPARSTGAERAAIATATVLAVLAVTLRAVSAGIVEMGDGVQHYLQARYCWMHPTLLLDLWGKPLFVLLASPFAQIGHAGITAFNALAAVAACWAAARLLRPAGSLAPVAFPLLVVPAPLYLLMVIGGMTEILFGLLTVLVLYAIVDERPVLAAVLASLTPFARPEYVAFLPLVVGWSVWRRQWRVLPWYATGWMVYGLLTGMVYGDPFWFWTHGPYASGPSLYGSGDLWQFVRAAPDIFGLPLLVLFLLALCVWPWVQRADVEQRRAHRLLLLTAAAPVVLTFAVHSYIWWQGIHASAGLSRVIVTVVPLAAVFTLFTLGRAVVRWAWPRVLRAVAGTACVGLLVFVAIRTGSETLNGPLQRSGDQVALDAAGDALRSALRQTGLVSSTHPYAAFRAGVDPFDDARYRMLWGVDGRAGEIFRPGELIFWDSQLGPNEGGLPLAALLEDPRFTVRGVWLPRDGHTVYGDRAYEIFLFERKDAVRTMTVDTLIDMHRLAAGVQVRMDTLPYSKPGSWCFGAGEFPFHVERMPLTLGAQVIYDELTLEARMEPANITPGEFELVFKQATGGADIRYDQLDMTGDQLRATWRVPPSAPDIEQHLYFWNVGRAPFTLTDFRLIRHRWTQW